MRLPVLLAAAVVPLTSCHESEQSIQVTETRELTLFDQKFPGDLKDHPPLGWRRIPPTQFRSVNFVGGPDEVVEIFAGNSGGGALTNANRWLGQFGLSPAPDETTFATIEILGRSALLVEATGTYSAGMGAAPAENYALIGAIRQSGEDVLTYKMIGPAAIVEGMREEFLTYCKTLERVDVHIIKTSETETPES
ncbi:hypothetical protein N9A94_04635 [Akkermansiaceae bacterium]|nr:hypothetical protein [Akkermansiaceae bacterium]MDB4537910.1 hypothetical protein [Akkermansiaceae bacterium]